MSASASAPAPKQQIQIPVVSMDQVLAFVQQAVEQARSGALWTALDQVNQVVSQRTEISAGMLASEFFFGPRGSSSTVGRALLVLNGFSLASFAFHSADRVGTLRAATGLALKGEAEVLAHGLMLNLGAAGLAGLYAGLAGPENNVMSVLALGAAKGALAFVALSFAGGVADAKAVKPEHVKLLDLFRQQWRTGAVLVAYALLLAWRNRDRASGPRWAVEMEARLEDRIDTMALELSKDGFKPAAVAATDS